MTHIVLQGGLAKYYLPVIVNQAILNVSMYHLCSAEVSPECLYSSLNIFFCFNFRKPALFPMCEMCETGCTAQSWVGILAVILGLSGTSHLGLHTQDQTIQPHGIKISQKGGYSFCLKKQENSQYFKREVDLLHQSCTKRHKPLLTPHLPVPWGFPGLLGQEESVLWGGGRGKNSQENCKYQESQHEF